MSRMLLLGVGGLISAGALTTPSFVGAGSGSVALGNPTPDYPGSLAADDYFQCVCWSIANPPTDPSLPAGWTLLYTDDNPFVKQWVFEKDDRATGSESGTITVSWDSNLNFARIYAFRDVALSSYIEGADTTQSDTGTLNAPSVAASGNARLAVAYIAKTGDTGMGDFTGESGGDWTEAVAEFGNAFGLGGDGQIQTADLSSGGTISGGSATYSGTPNSVCRAFALVGS